ncbi:MAG: squalene/phytoene synthase family protein [Chthoniobacterales bacterium]|nr:squalene/phytoene synthase family protein [Chthoniobacterales bacterium]
MQTFHSLLKGVSRSFYLSLCLLPASVRPTLSLAYLLARASDAVADAAAAPLSLRRDLLVGLPGKWTSAEGLVSLPEAEKDLLEALPTLIRQAEASPDREEILAAWKTIRSGQLFDLQRFSPGAPALSLAEATHYTGLVAGCVGKFWTEICFKHIPGYSREPLGAMSGLGFDFGCGLQWINILRDRHEDAAAGRLYVPPEDFPAALRIARENLASGARYVRHVRPRRLRVACRLPLDIGVRTLDLVEKNPRAPRAKVPRGFVWITLLRALWH